jgi:hypothetical protein
MSQPPPPAASSSSSSSALPPPVNKHAPTPVELQRLQLAKLLKDPAKPVSIPAPPKEKVYKVRYEGIVKNVQGSSAGAGSGEFHVYKQSRRREYERLKLMDEKAKKVGCRRKLLCRFTLTIHVSRIKRLKNSKVGNENEKNKLMPKQRRTGRSAKKRNQINWARRKMVLLVPRTVMILRRL